MMTMMMMVMVVMVVVKKSSPAGHAPHKAERGAVKTILAVRDIGSDIPQQAAKLYG